MPVDQRRCVNRLIDEMATLMLAEFDAETRFRTRAERGKGKAEWGLELLEKPAGGRTRRDRSGRSAWGRLVAS